MPLAAALGICCGFSQPNDFCQKIDARWRERSPGKRGQVRWIGDEETSSGCFDSEAENTHTTQKLWSFR